MPLAPTRVIRTPRYAVFCNGVNAYAVIEPFTVYGWSEITIEELIYPFHPKANAEYSKLSMIGDYWTDFPSTFHETNNRYDYTIINAVWVARRPDGTKSYISYSFRAYVNIWVHVVRRFTETREYSVWVNAERKYSSSVPADYKTVLEWDPNNATHPEYYRRFVLGANVRFGGHMKVSYYTFRVYDRAIEQSEIEENLRTPWAPVRSGLKVWLVADPAYIKDIDGDGILEWIDLSGNNNHAKLYNAQLVELIRAPTRILAPTRTLAPVR